MADNIDPKRANVSLGLAVARWKKFPDDSIEKSLDNPSEWVQEAAIMNHYLPAHLAKAGYSFIAVVPNEFAVGIKKVRHYAGLIYKHAIPIAALKGIADIAAADIADNEGFRKSAVDHGGASIDDLALRSSRLFATANDLEGVL